MKYIFPSAIGFFLMILSFSSFADKVIITGEPVVIERQGDIYVAPKTFNQYKSETDYLYVTIDNEKKVCYLGKYPGLNLDASDIIVDIDGKKYTWKCYTYDPKYFVIQKR